MAVLLPIAAVIGAVLFVGWALAMLSLVTQNSIFGWYLPHGIPMWVGLLALFAIYMIVSAPFRAIRGNGNHAAGYHPGWRALHAVIWICFVVLVSWVAYTFFPGVRSLSPTQERVPGVSVRPIIASSQNSYATRSIERVERDPVASKQEPRTLMVVANRRPEFRASAEAVLRGEMTAAQAQQDATNTSTRIAIIGDSDFATNSFFHVMGNGKLFLNTVNYLAARENLIGIEPRTFDRPQVNLTNQQMRGVVFLSMVLIPSLMALIGVAVWWRQR